MPQQDTPVQKNENAVTASLRKWGDAHGFVTAYTTQGKHSTHSLHYLGRADDLVGTEPSVDSDVLLRIDQTIIAEIPHQYIQELIYAGPGGVCMYAGKVLSHAEAVAIYTQAVLDEHHNHVHLGVTPDFSYNGRQQITMPDATLLQVDHDGDDPNAPNIVGPVIFQTAGHDSNGVCTGYYIFSIATGELHSFGPGAKFYGRSEVMSIVQGA